MEVTYMGYPPSNEYSYTRGWPRLSYAVIQNAQTEELRSEFLYLSHRVVFAARVSNEIASCFFSNMINVYSELWARRQHGGLVDPLDNRTVFRFQFTQDMESQINSDRMLRLLLHCNTWFISM